MKKLFGILTRVVGTSARAFVALVGLAGVAALATNYTMTQGSGTTFGSLVVGGVNYAQQFICDLTTPAQCAAVSAAGAVKVDGSAVTQPVSGTVTANVGSGTQPVSAASGAFASGSHASGSFASGALASGSVASGAMVDLGSQADSACGTATGTCSLIALQKYNNTATSGAIPAQSGIGNVNIGAVQSAGSAYETVAASATAQAMGATGATGDYLSHCVIYPATTSPGVVTVFDNANAAATNVIAFPGGASSVSNLVPFAMPVGALSTAGAWKVTTGTNVSVTCYGKFT